MTPGSPVVLHLTNPTEKFWALLQRIDMTGIVVRGINLSSFDDWMHESARGEETLGLITMFFPMVRVERMFLDEPVGAVESYSQQFERRVGHSIEEHLGLTDPGSDLVS